MMQFSPNLQFFFLMSSLKTLCQYFSSDVLREVFSGKKSPHKAQYSSSSVAAKENMRVEQEEMMTLAPLPSTNTMATIAVISPASSPQKPNTTDL